MRLMSASPTAALLAAAALAVRAGAAAPAEAVQSLPRLDAQTSLLVVAPHPDDETLCCAGVIQRVVRAGGRASIVWITSGDASELDLLLIEKSPFVKPATARDLAATRIGIIAPPACSPSPSAPATVCCPACATGSCMAGKAGPPRGGSCLACRSLRHRAATLWRWRLSHSNLPRRTASSRQCVPTTR